MTNNKTQQKPCLISCNVIEQELKHLIKTGELDVDLVLIDSYYHVDYDLLEKNLRETLTKQLQKIQRPLILLYGDLCLGQNNEMNSLAKEFGVTKVKAENCIDCVLGGKNSLFEADPNKELIFLTSGMISNWKKYRKKIKEDAKKEGVSEEALAKMYSSIKGLVYLDTVGNLEEPLQKIKQLKIDLPILEIKKIGVNKLKTLINETIEQAQKQDKQLL